MGDFQVVSRRPLDGAKYHKAPMAYRDGMGPEPVLANYLKGSPQAPKNYEKGNKDTVQAKEAHVTRIVMKFADYTGESVWHCHVLEHEDNDMMRPLSVEP
jgi:FtsP/CotA-like multicopper oxidase with cupredoxin domain